MNDINALLDTHGNAVYSFCLFLAGNKRDGEDLFQQTVLRAMELLSRIDKNKNPKSYLLSVAVNLWKNTVRKRARRNRIAPTVSIENEGALFIDNGIDIESDAIKKETREALRGIINGLDDKRRIPLILFYSEEMKISEIASFLKKPEGTVKRLLYEAKKIIKQELEMKGYE